MEVPNIKFRENPSSGAESFHADRRTDLTMLIAAFRNFASAPNIRVRRLLNDLTPQITILLEKLTVS